MRVFPFTFWLAAAQLVYAGSEPPDSTAVREDVQASLRAEREAELDLAVGAIRLMLLRARTRLVQDRYDEAIELAWKGLETVDKLPPSVDRASLVGPLEEVIIDARAQRGGRADPGIERVEPPAERAELEAARAELEAAQGVRPEPFPERKPLTVTDVRLRDAERLRYEADLRHGYKSDEADLLAQGGEDRRIPGKVLVYPDDWVERSKRRERYRHGIIYEGPPFRGEDGEVRQTIVYDIQSLIFPVPHFHDLPVMDLRVATREAADRQALRSASEIFTGYAHDLTQGTPLLIFFGGIDDVRTIDGVDERQQADLMRIVEQVLEAQ